MQATRQHVWSIFTTLIFVLIISACTSPKGKVEDGKRWYMMNNCYGCHGLNGNDGKGPKINTDDLSFRHFLSIVRDANSPIMPKFPEEKVSRQDVADIYAWLKTVH